MIESPKIIVACEESQRVCLSFRELGYEAYSCDICEPSGGHTEWHILGNALDVLNPQYHAYNGRTEIFFHTMDGAMHSVPKWDLIIAHPPCTYLTCTGNRWFNVARYGDKARERQRERERAVEFFMEFVNADCDCIAVENPVGHMSTVYRKSDQIIQPYEFGDPARKATCLWLKGLPKLLPTDIVEPKIREYIRKDGRIARFSEDYDAGGSADRSCRRSKTYWGIAKAMAKQWGKFVYDKINRKENEDESLSEPR